MSQQQNDVFTSGYTLNPEKKSTRVDVVFLSPEFTFLHFFFLLEDITHPCVDAKWQEQSRIERAHQPDVLFKDWENHDGERRCMTTTQTHIEW